VLEYSSSHIAATHLKNYHNPLYYLQTAIIPLMKKKPEFKVESPYKPAGDQPTAIKELSESILKGNRYQTLEGVTGSGKTHTMARVIENVKMPTIIMTHNKTLAAQLYSEFRQFFPHNHVEYFVSYYDYYQPEAYMHSQLSA